MLICNATVWIDSERVVPRQHRADWLERHGVPGDKLPFEVSAPARTWVDAGCHLSADGQLQKVSREAVDALCIPARDLVRDHFPQNTIPARAAEQALRKAAGRRRRVASEAERRSMVVEYALTAASRWVAEHGTSQMRHQVLDGVDARKVVVDWVWLEFVRYLGIDPIAFNPERLSTRYNPSSLSKEVRACLIETVKDFSHPSCVKISVLEVSRLSNVPDGRPFATVVPIKFEIPGYAPTTAVWDGEKPI